MCGRGIKALGGLLLAVVAAGDSACRRSTTEVLVHLQADEPVAAYRATLIGPGQETTTATISAGDAAERSFGVAPRSEDPTRMITVTVEAAFVSGGSYRITQIIPQFRPGELGHLYFFFARACESVTCPVGQVCSRCGCEDASASPYAPEPPLSWTGGCMTPEPDGGVPDAGPGDSGEPDAGVRPERFAAVDGRPGAEGTLKDPWDLATALGQPPGLIPGTILRLRGGTYRASAWTSSISGTAAQPIDVEPYEGEAVTIDAEDRLGSVVIGGAHTAWRGIEFMKSNAERTWVDGRGDFLVHGEDTRFFRCAFHDFGSVISGPGHAGGEFTGNLFFNNGFKISDDIIEGDGLRIYNDPGKKLVRDNVFFGNAAANIRTEYQLTSTSTAEMSFEGNVGFSSDAQLIANGSIPISRLAILGNDFYQPEPVGRGVMLGFPQSQLNRDARVEDNRIVGGFGVLSLAEWTSLSVTRNLIVGTDPNQFLIFHELEDGIPRSSMDIDRNTYVAASMNMEGFFFREGTFGAVNALDFAGWKNATGWDRASSFRTTTSTGAEVIVRPADGDRALVIIHNDARAQSVEVDPNQNGPMLAPGDRFELRFAGNFFGAPIALGTYQGGSITVPMNALVIAPPIGDGFTSAGTTGPAFGAFILLRER